MTQCIICLKDHINTTVEHIVPRALGNIHYILPRGKLCGTCNHRFSRYEHAVLNSQPWLKYRIGLHLVHSSTTDASHKLRAMDIRRFLLKMMYESIYKSRPNLFHLYCLESVRSELNGGAEAACVIFENKRLQKSKPVPRWMDKWRLRRNNLSLSYLEGQQSLWFEFRFMDLSYVIKTSSSTYCRRFLSRFESE